MPAPMAGVRSIPLVGEPAEIQQNDVLANHNRRIRRKLDWNDEMKRILVRCYLEARQSDARRYMRRMKENWCKRQLELDWVPPQTFADNARRFLPSHE